MQMQKAHILIVFFFVASLHHDNVKMVTTQTMALKWLLLCNLPGHYHLSKKRPNVVTKCSVLQSSLFEKEQSEPFEHKGYPWSKVTCSMMASFYLPLFPLPSVALEGNVEKESWTY
ncbi:hypothetical protein ILYODFUR_009755 [Ilyodon furcidens]|uniref:Secreted protein n=1 Tax=Ilyodon furcidens TaxID=33524 RepID=A0ABV0TIL4_9TELE